MAGQRHSGQVFRNDENIRVEERDFIFPHELSSYLEIPIKVARLLIEWGYVPPLNRVPGTCIFFWSKSSLAELRHQVGPGGTNAGRVDYFMSMDREE